MPEPNCTLIEETNTEKAMTEDLIIRISPDLLARIEEFWHHRQLKSRVAAIRELLHIGLAFAEVEDEADDAKA